MNYPPNQQPQEFLYQTSYVGFYIKVFPDHIEFRSNKGVQSVPMSQFAGVQEAMPGIMKIIIQTTDGQEYDVPTMKKKEAQQAILQAYANHMNANQRAEVQPHYQQHPSSPYIPQPPYVQPHTPPKKKRLPWWGWVIVVIVILGLCGGISNALSPKPQVNQGSGTNQQPTSDSANGVTPNPTPRPIQYPPKTEADLRGLAAEGDASVIHTYHSEKVGMVAACPEVRQEVMVSSSITGQKLAEDLLAYFYKEQLNNPCGSIVFAYHNKAEENEGTYTAGRIDYTVNDSSGQANMDPNATDLKYDLTLDVGGFMTGQKEYDVTY